MLPQMQILMILLFSGQNDQNEWNNIKVNFGIVSEWNLQSDYLDKHGALKPVGMKIQIKEITCFQQEHL
jgi:hypothetical protein